MHAWISLSSVYRIFGLYEKAIGEAQEATRLAPNHALAHLNLVEGYLGLNRFEEAKTICEQQISKGNDSPYFHFGLYAIAFIEGDSAGMERQAEWAKGKPDDDRILLGRAEAAAFSGSDNSCPCLGYFWSSTPSTGASRRLQQAFSQQYSGQYSVGAPHPRKR